MKKTKSPAAAEKEKKVPYYRKPEDMPLDEWQIALRRQFATKQEFTITNTGQHPVFSDFNVFNPKSGNTYKISIRDNEKSHHFCSCPDFKINGLGTCKHIEYVLFKLKQVKKNHKYFNDNQQHTYSSLSIYYGNERKIRFKKGDDDTLHHLAKDYFDSKGFLLQDKLDDVHQFIEQALAIDPGFRVYPDVFDMLHLAKQEKERKQLVQKIFPEGTNSQIFDDLINTRLYPYQKDGVIKILETGRVLLADEMGLGKTIQAIAAVELFIKYFNVKKVLIICPTSLKYQWKKEIEKFSEKDVVVLEGLVHKRKKLYREQSLYKIISYGTARTDLDNINECNAELVILDEAQRIKNWKTKTAQAVKKIHSHYAIVLTGTPLENRLEEIHSIVEFIDEYKLGPLYRFLYNHQVTDEFGKVKGYKGLRKINETLAPILIRRTKKEIIDQLPGRIDKNYFVEMTKKQAIEHNDYYEVVCKLVSKWIRIGYLTEEEREKLLVCLNCMRMVSDSTYILDQTTRHDNKPGEVMKLLSEILENPDNKIVVFSQWKKMFELLIEELEERKIRFEYLNGDVPSKERRMMVERFHHDDECKIFLSTDAGGVGMNLQCANMLINIDLPWNPAVLEQRVGRIYRLGQKKHVSVYNFISKGSIEHRILYLLDFKVSVFKGTLDEDGANDVMLDDNYSGFIKSLETLTNIDLDDDNSKNRKKNKKADSSPGVNKVIYKVFPGKEEIKSGKMNAKNKCDKNDFNKKSHPKKKPAGKGIFTKVKRFLSRMFRL